MPQQRRSRKQKGGSYTGGYGAYSYTGPAFVSAAHVPVESHAASNYNCGWTLRSPPIVTMQGAAPQLGGSRRKTKSQRGGGCGCGLQRGGGGGTGGYGFDITNNSLGPGNYVSLTRGPCPPPPVARQLGGDASYRDLAAIDSYKTGYEFGPRGVVSTNSAHYLDPIGYDRTCRGGARRSRKAKKAKKAKKNRKH